MRLTAEGQLEHGGGDDQGDNADGDVDVEDPGPGVVVGDVALVNVTVAGLPASAVHVPVPVAAMTVVEY